MLGRLKRGLAPPAAKSATASIMNDGSIRWMAAWRTGRRSSMGSTRRLAAAIEDGDAIEWAAGFSAACMEKLIGVGRKANFHTIPDGRGFFMEL